MPLLFGVATTARLDNPLVCLWRSKTQTTDWSFIGGGRMWKKMPYIGPNLKQAGHGGGSILGDPVIQVVNKRRLREEAPRDEWGEACKPFSRLHSRYCT